MGIYQRPDSPFWWLLLERPGKAPLREKTPIPKDGGVPEQTKEHRRQAQEAYGKRMADLARRHYQLPGQTEERTFKDHRAWYAAHVTAHKGGAVKEQSMLRTLGAFFDAYALHEIDQALVREWRTARRVTVKASTVTREEEVLKHILNQAVPKYLDANPIAGMRRLRREDTETRILTADEETALLKAANDPIAKAAILCGLDALMRRGSVAKLSRAQDHQTYLTLLNAKTGTYKVPVSHRLRSALDAVPANGATFFHATSIEIGDWFQQACERAKVTLGREAGGVTFHSLRHTGASRMLADGVDIKTVMRIGGWRTLTVLERYLHPTDAVAQAAVNTIGKHVPITRPTKSGRKARKRPQ